MHSMSTLRCACIGLLHIYVGLHVGQQMQSSARWAGMRSMFHMLQLSVHQALKCACIDVMHIWMPHWKWSAQHIDDALCCCSNAHQSQNLYVTSDEAVIGELQCTAYYHEMMTCRKNRVSVSSPMCIANVSWACITVMCIWEIVLSIRVLNWKWAHMLWFQCTAW